MIPSWLTHRQATNLPQDFPLATDTRVPRAIQEAQAWIVGGNGDVILTTSPVHSTPGDPWQVLASCAPVR